MERRRIRIAHEPKESEDLRGLREQVNAMIDEMMGLENKKPGALT